MLISTELECITSYETGRKSVSMDIEDLHQGAVLTSPQLRAGKSSFNLKTLKPSKLYTRLLNLDIFGLSPI